MTEPMVGVALVVHNACGQTRECLESLRWSRYPSVYTVVVDDGSTDGTWEMLQQDFPQVVAVRGDGNLWWTGGTNWAIRICLEAGCDYILLLNPDVIVEPMTISLLVSSSRMLEDAIVSPVVLIRDEPDLLWEAGHTWGPLIKGVPIIWITKYLYKHGTPISVLPDKPYSVVSVVGRGGLMPRTALLKLGLFDEKRLPHYGADADMAARASRAGYPMYVVPAAKVRLDPKQTGMVQAKSWGVAFSQYWRYLFSRKHGEAIRVLYYWNVNNLPIYSALPSYLFSLTLNTFRYWQRFLSSPKH